MIKTTLIDFVQDRLSSSLLCFLHSIFRNHLLIQVPAKEWYAKNFESFSLNLTIRLLFLHTIPLSFSCRATHASEASCFECNQVGNGVKHSQGDFFWPFGSPHFGPKTTYRAALHTPHSQSHRTTRQSWQKVELQELRAEIGKSLASKFLFFLIPDTEVFQTKIAVIWKLCALEHPTEADVGPLNHKSEEDNVLDMIIF